MIHMKYQDLFSVKKKKKINKIKKNKINAESSSAAVVTGTLTI